MPKLFYFCNLMTEKSKWESVLSFFKENFTDGETPDLDSILYLIGVQELGQGSRKFSKDDKVNLMHIAVCRLLEPYGYYRFDGKDADGWPHFEFVSELPQLKPNEQTLLMKKAIVHYFEEQDLI